MSKTDYIKGRYGLLHNVEYFPLGRPAMAGSRPLRVNVLVVKYIFRADRVFSIVMLN